MIKDYICAFVGVLIKQRTLLQYRLHEPKYITEYFGNAVFKEGHITVIMM